MIVSIDSHSFDDNNIFSCIVGQHGKEPWDFEFTIPINQDNSFIESCLYKDVIILGTNPSSVPTQEESGFEPKEDFVITKIEQLHDVSQSKYIVSGIGKAERILELTPALYNLEPAPNETGFNYLKRVLETLTGAKWSFTIRGEIKFNFPPVKKGTLVATWFWDGFKTEKAVCVIRTVIDRKEYHMDISGEEGAKIVYLTKFVSRRRIWENYYNSAYVTGNDSLFVFSTKPNNQSFINKITNCTFGAQSLHFGLPDEYPAVQYNHNLDDVISKVLYAKGWKFDEYQNRNIVIDNNKLTCMRQIFFTRFEWYDMVFLEPEFLQDPNIPTSGYDGVKVALCTRLPIKMEDLLAKMEVVHFYEDPTNYERHIRPLVPDAIVDNVAYFSDWKKFFPQVNSSKAIWYNGGIKCSYRAPVKPAPEDASVSNQGILDVLALGSANLVFPNGNPECDYEISDKEYSLIDIGDEVHTLEEDTISILTDKIITYENGEVHYDCTTKDLIELDMEQ